jgi:hypothetical protein
MALCKLFLNPSDFTLASSATDAGNRGVSGKMRSNPISRGYARRTVSGWPDVQGSGTLRKYLFSQLRSRSRLPLFYLEPNGFAYASSAAVTPVADELLIRQPQVHVRFCERPEVKSPGLLSDVG